MKRKLIDYDSFEKIKSGSLTNVHAELKQATDMLAEAVGVETLRVESYRSNSVLFESEEGELVRADYKLGDGYVQFDNIEQVVINEGVENEKAREVISKMIDSLIESNESAASEMLNEWLDMPRNKRVLNENVKGRRQPVARQPQGQKEKNESQEEKSRTIEKRKVHVRQNQVERLRETKPRPKDQRRSADDRGLDQKDQIRTGQETHEGMAHYSRKCHELRGLQHKWT